MSAEALQRQSLEAPCRVTLRVRLRGGAERWLRVSLAPVEEGARLTGFALLVEAWDTEVERSQLDLKGAQLQGAVHALQAMEGALTEPLLALQGNLQLLRMSLGETEGVAQEGLEGALAACRQLASLGDSLWALAGRREPPVGGRPESAATTERMESSVATPGLLPGKQAHRTRRR
jgi:hypothetical protein